jgi:hypothetical protein
VLEVPAQGCCWQQAVWTLSHLLLVPAQASLHHHQLWAVGWVGLQLLPMVMVVVVVLVMVQMTVVAAAPV